MFIFKNPDKKLSIFQNFDADRGLKQSQNDGRSHLHSRSNRSGQKISQKLGPKGSKSIADLWTAALDQYENERRHHEFIRACFRSGCLYYASQKYARILNTLPNDFVALKMQSQIEVFGMQDSFVKPNNKKLSPQTLRLIDAVTLVSVLIALIGFIYSSQHDLIGIGLSIFVLGLGSKYFFSKN
jgi:hypothetical protein